MGRSTEPAPRTRIRVLFGYLTGAAEGPAASADAIVVESGSGPRVLQRFALGGVTGCLFEGGAVEVSPHHRAIGDGLAVGYVRDGEVSVSQGSDHVTLSPGQLVLYNAATPFHVQSPGPHSYLVVRVPLHRLRVPQLDTDTIFARDLSPYPSAELLGVLLASLADARKRLSPAAAQHVGDAVTSCVHAVLSEYHQSVTSCQSVLLFERLTCWLDDHLHDADLSAESLARSQFLSPRYVRKIFADHGSTVSEYVRRRRLELIRNDLLDPRHETAKVSALAARWGFRDASVFSRAFSREFGESPRRFRRRHGLGVNES
jgi:AraC-like DNA-binding protein